MGALAGPAHLLVLLACAALLLFPQAGAADYSDSEHKFIGWQGEVDRDHSPQADDEDGSDAPNSKRRWIETISWKPRAFVFHNFLSPEECDHLREVALSRLERSLVVGGKTGEEVDDIRTSYSASLSLAEDAVVASIEHRIAAWTHYPVAHGEGMEVLRYKNGQKYDAHWDWFDEWEIKNDPVGQRAATVLLYLSDVEPDAGGETALPLAFPIDEATQGVEGKGLSACASNMGISVVPHKGDALLFHDMDPGAGPTDRAALHASCPTFKGQKWTATKWIHNKPYQPKGAVEDMERRGFGTDPFQGGFMPRGWTKESWQQQHGGAEGSD